MIPPGDLARAADAPAPRHRYRDRMRRPSASELRPPVSDILLAGALTALAQFEVWSGMQYQDAPVHPGQKAVVVPALALATIAVPWRRIFPLGGLVASGGLISAMALAFGAGDGGPSLFVLLLVLVYSAAAHSDRPVAVALITTAIVAVHDLRNDQIGGIGDALFAPALAAIAFAFGRAVRARHEQSALRAETAVTDERARIARELHDAVAHSVGVMVVQAQGTRQIVGTGGDPRVGEALDHIERAGQDALVEMRRLLGLLRDGGSGDGDRRTAPGGGHGHTNMRERAAMCGGTVRVGRRPEGGYAVTAVLPTTGAPA